MSFQTELSYGGYTIELKPWMVWVAILMLIGPPLLFIATYASWVEKRPWRHRTATVLVLGDIGRSPRMMYHAESLAKSGWDTYMVGYGDTTPIPSLLETPRVHFLHLHDPPRLLLKLPWIFRAPIRVFYQIISVVYLCVFKIPYNTQIFMVQNPPSIPTLFLAQIISATTRSKLIIDWHNTGYSILAMRLGMNYIVRIARAFERRFGRVAYAHLFVTDALAKYLTKEWNLEGRTVVLHDRPPSQFRRTEVISQLNLYRRIDKYLHPPMPAWATSKSIKKTPFTEMTPNGPVKRADRPAMAVSSTSWTADEDFSLLLHALDMYQVAKTKDNSLPKLVVIITGRGELRAPFEAEVAKRERAGEWPDVCVRCVFLSAKDYPLLLGSADLGISMHQSSSGRDLPMKVVDMFGSGLPVLARNFACLGELVQDGVNGRVFDNADQLADELIDTLTGFPNAPKLKALEVFFQVPPSNVGRRLIPAGKEVLWSTWDENWDAVMRRGLLDFRRPV